MNPMGPTITWILSVIKAACWGCRYSVFLAFLSFFSFKGLRSVSFKTLSLRSALFQSGIEGRKKLWDHRVLLLLHFADQRA
ncbi:hypothetical protein RIF29_18707 [Crotalaria pallida]|uniref:Uncharacterized protein n=1 Tax=Crotalaria pallida TaxID=3830 RepID=A0AAN9EYN3_CROPI